MKGSWENETMLQTLQYYLDQKQSKDLLEAQAETYKFMPLIPRQTIWRRTVLLEYGVPLDLAYKRELSFSDYSKYLGKDITSMTHLETKFRNSLTRRKSLMKESNITVDHSSDIAVNQNTERKFCSVPMCKSDSELLPHLTFFPLPDDDEKLALWAERCRKPEWADPAKIIFAKKYTLICAHHFSKSMFHDADQKILTEDAFPMVMKDNSAPPNLPIPVVNLDQNDLAQIDLEIDLLGNMGPIDFENPISSITIEGNEPPPRTNLVNGVEPLNPTLTTVSDLNECPESPPALPSPRLLRSRNEESAVMAKLVVKLKRKNTTGQRKRTIKSALNKKRKNHPFGTRKKPRKVLLNDNCCVPRCSKFCREGFFVCTPCMEKGFVACAVSSCKKLFNSNDDNASYVYFPPDNNDLNRKWKNAIEAIDNWDSNTAVICLRHFQKPQDFSNDGLSLKLNAVPSVDVKRRKTQPKIIQKTVPENRRANAGRSFTSPRNTMQQPSRIIPSRKLTTNKIKPDSVQPSTINQQQNVRNDSKKQRRTISGVKALLTIRGLRLKNEHYQLQIEKLRLQNLILEKQLEQMSK